MMKGVNWVPAVQNLKTAEAISEFLREKVRFGILYRTNCSFVLPLEGRRLVSRAYNKIRVIVLFV